MARWRAAGDARDAMVSALRVNAVRSWKAGAQAVAPG